MSSPLKKVSFSLKNILAIFVVNHSLRVCKALMK